METVPQQFLLFIDPLAFIIWSLQPQTPPTSTVPSTPLQFPFEYNNTTSCCKAREKAGDILINMFESAQGKFKGHWNLEIEFFFDLLLSDSGYLSRADGMPTLPQSSLVDRKTNTDQQMTKRLDWNGPDSDCLLFQVQNWDVACVTTNTHSKLLPLLFKCSKCLIWFQLKSVSLVRLERHQVKHLSLNF